MKLDAISSNNAFKININQQNTLMNEKHENTYVYAYSEFFMEYKNGHKTNLEMIF